MQVHDAYKEYLQKIAQIRDIIFITRVDIDIDVEKTTQIFENHIKCKYNDTRWNTENSYYTVFDFYNKEVNDYYYE